MLALGGSGPASIGERVRALGGHFVIDSTEAGARLDILLPLIQEWREPSHPAAPRPASGGGGDANPGD